MIAAPTGSGKTVCAELAVLRNHSKVPGSVMRAVYIAPLEAIAKTRYHDWNKRLGQGLGIEVVDFTGEIPRDWKPPEKGYIIISTPEKWDAQSRRWKRLHYVAQVTLFVIDDIHMIGSKEGHVLEAMVSRMRYIASKIETKIRFVALSYSLTDAEDFGKWIGASSNSLFNFSPDVRPVPLEMHVKGLDFGDYEARMNGMKQPAYSSIVQYSNGQPAIVFVPTMKHVEQTAVAFKENASMEHGEKPVFVLRSLKELEPFVDRIQDEILRSTLLVGIGYMHEGLSDEDQEVVKQLFEDGWIQVCVVRSSMCWEVPFLAHLVVVMGTQYYGGSENAHRDFPVTDLLQMIGRALVDNSGKCVVICHSPRQEYYKKILSEPLSVESHLQNHWHDYFNAEIAAGTVQTMKDAVDAFAWTFMHRRLLKNPEYYEFKGLTQMHYSFQLTELVKDRMSELEAIGWVRVGEDDALFPGVLSKFASLYRVGYSTVRYFTAFSSLESTMENLLQTLTNASKFEDLAVRPGEDEELKTLNTRQRFPIKYNWRSDPRAKVMVLLQAHLSRQTISRALERDLRQVVVFARQQLPFLVQLFYNKASVDKTLEAIDTLFQAIDLFKMVTQKMWHDDLILLQVPNFSKELATKCRTKGIMTVSDLLKMKDAERKELLKLEDTQLIDILKFCKRFMGINVSAEMKAGDKTAFEVAFEGVSGLDTTWWLVALNDHHGLLRCKRVVSLPENFKVKLEINRPTRELREVTLHVKSEVFFVRDFRFEFLMD